MKAMDAGGRGAVRADPGQERPSRENPAPSCGIPRMQGEACDSPPGPLGGTPSAQGVLPGRRARGVGGRAPAQGTVLPSPGQ